VRIIAGEFRGRALIEPRFDTTRPITDRVKQSIFDVLTPLIEDTLVYDCFCGTGSMGLECLSRGAKQAVFFDADRKALAGLKTNITTLKVDDRTRVYPGDIFHIIRMGKPEDRCGLLFLDPPYRFLIEKSDELRSLCSRLIEAHLAPDAVVVFRHDTKDALPFDGLEQYDVRTYGSMTIELLRLANKTSDTV